MSFMRDRGRCRRTAETLRAAPESAPARPTCHRDRPAPTRSRCPTRPSVISHPRLTPLPPYSSFGLSTRCSRHARISSSSSPCQSPLCVSTSSRTRVHGTCALMTSRSAAREHRRVRRVGEHREEGFLVRELAAERVRHAHRAVAVHASTRARALGRLGEDVVHEHATIDEIDACALRAQRAVAVTPAPADRTRSSERRRR